MTLFAFPQQKEIAIAFYNTENFFDTIDDPHKSDNEFLPSSKHNWNSEKYFNKIKRIGQVLDSIASPSLPALAGFCEVENETCIKDLLAYSSLKNHNYGFAITNSPDVRSIDVALIYDKSFFTLKSFREISATNPALPENKTRNILYAVLQKQNKGELHVFVNHWPSMRDGESESEPRRMYAAGQLKKYIDSILKHENNAQIIVMGDFNETPDKQAISKSLGAVSIDTGGQLLNPFFPLAREGQGTHYFDKEWNVLDQIMVSTSLVSGQGKFKYISKSAHIFKHDMLLYTAPKLKVKLPNRTYKGTRYYNGYSDHLPVIIRLSEQK